MRSLLACNLWWTSQRDEACCGWHASIQSYPNLRVTAPPCADVFCTGVTILRQGGNAVDAAITTALCQGILSPAASGLGGGHFMVIRAPNGTTEVIDAREPAPAAATENMFQGLSPNMLTVNINMAQVLIFAYKPMCVFIFMLRYRSHPYVFSFLLHSQSHQTNSECL